MEKIFCFYADRSLYCWGTYGALNKETFNIIGVNYEYI